MGLTGAAVRLGNASNFGVQETSPRGCSEFDGDLYVLGTRRLILMSNLSQGEGEYVSQTLVNASFVELFNLGALGEHDGRLYLTDGSDLYVFGDPFRGIFGTADTSVTIVGDLNASGDTLLPKGLASDGTNLHCVYDGRLTASDIYSIDVTDATKTLVGTIAWPSGLTGPRPLGLFYYDGAFHVVERSQGNLYRLSDPDPTNSNAMTATRVGTATQFGVSESIPTGSGVFGGSAYLVGSGNDAIYRFIDSDDPPPEVDAVLDITVSSTNVETSGDVIATFTFDKAVTEFTAEDVIISAGTKGALSGSGASYTMTVTAPSSGSGTVTVSVAEDVVSPGNNADSVSFTYAEPVVPVWANIPTGEVDNTFEVELHFNVPVTGLEPGDLRFQAAGVTFLTPNAANTTITAIADTNNYRIAFDLPGILHTDCVIRLIRNAVTYDGSTYPAGDPVDSAEFRLETSMELRFVNVTIANQSFVVGDAVNLLLPEATGGVDARTYALSPALPSGLVFDATTRRITGAPTGRFSSNTFTYTATDSEGATAELTFTIVVTAPAITFSPTSFANQIWTIGTAVDLTLPSGSGGVGDLTPLLVGVLPIGITFTASTRALAGTPTAVFTVATFTYTLTDTEGESESITFTIVVNAAAVAFGAAWASVPTGTVDNTFEVELHFDVPVTGLEPTDLRLRTAGVTFITPSDSDTTITAIPNTNNYRIIFDLDGTYDRDCVIRFIRNAVTYDGSTYPADPIDSSEFRIVTPAALSFGGEAVDNQAWVVGTAVDLILPVASGGHATKTYSLSPSLPSGLDFNAVTRRITGTPTGRFSSATFTYTVTDGDNDTAQLTFTIVVTAVAITFSPASISDIDATVGTAISSVTLPEASGGVGTFTYSMEDTLPAGLSFNATTRVLSGTPTISTAQTSYTYRATDAEDVHADLEFNIAVTAAADLMPSFGSASIDEIIATENQAITAITLPAATGGDAPLSYLLSPSLPTGLTFTASTRVLSGTPTALLARTQYTYTVTDDDGDTATLQFHLSVIAAAPDLPGQVRGIGVTALSRSLRFVWDAPDAGDNPIQRYEYQLDGGTWTSTGSDMTMFVLDGLENGTEYSVRLRARSASGVGQASEAVTGTPAWPTPREGCYLLDLVESDFTGYTAPQLTATDTTLDADLGESINVGLIRIQTDAETDIVSVIVQGSPDGDTQYVHLGEMEIGAGEYHAIRLNDRSVQALRLMVKTVSTPANLHTIEVYAVRVDLSSNVTGFSAEELQLGQNSYRRYDGVLVTSDGLRTVPRVELSLAQLTTKQTDGLTALLGESDFYLLAGLDDRYRVSIATDALRFTGRRGAHSLALSLTGAVDLNNFTLAIEMEGQDISHLWIPEDGITVRRSIDTPQLNTVTTDTLTFALDNENFDFELNQPDNFFLRQGLNRHGRGAQVLIEINDTPVFAGFVWRVQSDLQSSRVQVQVVDMFAYMAQAEIQDLGEQLDLEITSFPGALDLYTTEDPVFPFPLFALPIVPGSVSATMSEDGATVDVEVVEVINTEGDLSPRRAEVDHTRGLLRFEAPPLDGQPTTIRAEWKIALQYKRIDTLIRRVLENTGIMDRIGITPTSVQSFSIEQIPILLSENRFSSHGRPYPSGLGIVRWMMRDATNKKRYFTHDDKLIEYDEGQDEYTELAEFPSSSTGVTPPAYGTLLTSESFDVPTGFQIDAIAVSPDYIWVNDDTANGVFRFTHTGTQVDATRFIDYRDNAMDYYNGTLYIRNRTYDPVTGVQGASPLSSLPAGAQGQSVDADGVRALFASPVRVGYYTLDGTLIQNYDNVTHSSSRAITVAGDTIYIGSQTTSNTLPEILAYDLDFNRVPSLDITPTADLGSDILGMDFYNGRLYVGYSRVGTLNTSIQVYHVGGEAQDRNYVPAQFDSHDFEDFYCLCSDTISGNQVSDRSFSPVRVYKYDKSADTFSVVLDEDDGEPQLAHPYTDAGSEVFRADNRKNFQVVRRSSKTLIFYRRVESAQSSIAVSNETDDTLTNIHTTLHSVGSGVPYGMDFALDIRSDGIHVYSFVVYYSATNSTLKVYRERFQPSGTQTEIFTETISRVEDDDDNEQYAVSVSDVILNDDDDKWYFVLTWGAEGTGTGKAELCTIAKDGSGSRTVIKTYDDPLLSARSPAEVDGRFFYVEGGWVRREKTSTDDDVPAEEHHYPNQGGTLIEIESDDSITDHGIIWRSATKAESPDPDPDSDIYDGYGLHNAIVSNLMADDSDNLHCVAGYGLPYDIEDNSPFSRLVDPILDRSNFNWIQWGQKHAGKIGSFPVSGQRGQPLTQALAAIGFANVGVPPTTMTDARLTGETVSTWQRYASIYFRSRHDAQVTLRTAVGTGAVSQLDVDAVGLPDAGDVLFGTEIFAYTSTVKQSGVIRELEGVTRAQHGSTASSHVAGITGVRVDGFIDAGDDSEIYTVRDRALDFINQKNRVTVGLAAGTVEASDTASIDDFGEFALSLGTSPVLFSRFDADWAELLADLYLDSLKEPKEVLAIATRLDLSVEVGQVVVVDIDYRIKIGYKAFVVTQVAHALPQAVTDIQLREV